MKQRLIDANALPAAYDTAHKGSPGAARKMIEDAPTVGGWISIKDRLPEDETIVIAYVQHKIGWYRIFAWHDVHGWHSSAEEFTDRESDYVTHWMPMPDPPEEDET